MLSILCIFFIAIFIEIIDIFNLANLFIITILDIWSKLCHLELMRLSLVNLETNLIGLT